MNDKNLGMILATATAAPIMIICCGGGLVLLGSALAGATGLFSGLGSLISALIAVAVGGLLLALLRLLRSGDECERPNSASEPRS